MAEREGTPYYDFGYLQSERCIVTAFAKDLSGIRGRRIADFWLKDIETYIRNNWNNKISGVSVDRLSFGPHKEIPNYYTKYLYGMETSFDVQSYVTWSNEPVSGAKSEYPVSGISINSGTIGKVWVIG